MNKLTLISIIGLSILSSCGRKTEETKPIRKDVTETVFASGSLEANGTYSLTAQSDGYIIDISFKENDIVKEGQVLAVIDNKQNILNTESAKALFDIAQSNTSADSPILLQAQNSVVNAKQKMDFDSTQTVRYKKLLDANSIAKAEYEKMALQYQTSKANYLNSLENFSNQKQLTNQQLVINKTQKNVNSILSGYNQIKAVCTGRVYQKFKQKGDFIRKGDVIASIGDADFIYAKVSIDESNIKKVEVGQEAVIQLNVDKTKTYKGRVAEILPYFNEQTQSFICKIFFTDSLDFKVTNTQLQANIIAGINRNALLIPRNFLSYGNLVKIKGSKNPVKVETRFVSSEWVQILSGIDENTTIVTNNITPK